MVEGDFSSRNMIEQMSFKAWDKPLETTKWIKNHKKKKNIEKNNKIKELSIAKSKIKSLRYGLLRLNFKKFLPMLWHLIKNATNILSAPPQI